MNKLIIDAANKNIFLMIIGNNNIYNITYENSKTNYEKIIILIDEFLGVKNLKIDIEGYEDRVLLSFLKNCKKQLYPKNIILEHASNHLWKYDLVKYLYNLVVLNITSSIDQKSF